MTDDLKILKAAKTVSRAGVRRGEHRYFDMDAVIASALHTAETLLQAGNKRRIKRWKMTFRFQIPRR